MKKFLLALTAVAAMTGSASAADLGARPYVKAPAPAPVASWTGFYIFGGAGGGLWNADSSVQTFPGAVLSSRDQRLGGSGWFGTVGLGYDWQFNGRWVAGLFADGQFGDIRGSLSDPNFATEGREKLRTSYAAGARLGYLVAPNVLSYVNAGYSGSEWSGTTQSSLFTPFAAVDTTKSFRRDGWFIGGGVENNLEPFRHLGTGLVHEDRIPFGFLRSRDAAPDLYRCQRRWSDRHRPHLQAVGPDHQHVAGLPLQLERPGRRQVLIRTQVQTSKPRHRPGLFRCGNARGRRPPSATCRRRRADFDLRPVRIGDRPTPSSAHRRGSRLRRTLVRAPPLYPNRSYGYCAPKFSWPRQSFMP
ncbi:opacity protein-like surface antigen [Bradyrhizobium diazoefficiens]